MKHPGRDERDQTDVDLEAINASSLYAMYCVFATAMPLPVDAASAELEDAVAETGVTIRGFYDVGGFRADADLMVWTLASDPRDLQAGYHAFRKTELGITLDPVWSVMGVHRPAEFNRTHVPSCFAGFAPRPGDIGVVQLPFQPKRGTELAPLRRLHPHLQVALPPARGFAFARPVHAAARLLYHQVTPFNSSSVMAPSRTI